MDRNEFTEYLCNNSVLGFEPVTTSRPGVLAPYYFDKHKINQGTVLNTVAEQLAEHVNKIESATEPFDWILGASYSGVGIASVLATKLSHDIGVRFDRKVPSYLGEKPITTKVPGRVLIVDDMISSGATQRRLVDIARRYGATSIVALAVFDRMEPGKTFSDLSGLKEFETVTGVNMYTSLTLADVLTYIKEKQPEHFTELMLYMRNHCVVNK